MQISTLLSYAGGFKDAVEEIKQLESAGLDMVWVPEAYSFDAPSAMGYLAANTERVTIASGILPIYSRTPTLLAMTAAGIDYLSDGRCMLGLGASGPQVIEGFHGVPYEAPVGKMKEIVEICRMVWRRDRVPVRVQCVHKTIEDYFHCLKQAGFRLLPDVHELKITSDHVELDPEFFEPLLDLPLHLAFQIEKQ